MTNEVPRVVLHVRTSGKPDAFIHSVISAAV